MTDENPDLDEMLVRIADFRDDYDRLMDAVHYLSMCYRTEAEADGIRRLEQIYRELNPKWGG